jgi:hypothetical protein
MENIQHNVDVDSKKFDTNQERFDVNPKNLPYDQWVKEEKARIMKEINETCRKVEEQYKKMSDDNPIKKLH